ncbi:hypothetical protein GCM10010260_56600 [Streptomyces filipinensis]|uniref:Uncharacterized protein n=1 Tax=Streptomyces filipinensis TaxID=66887 RepID=A0A918IGE6_9ACTN|nr:hypothetical protein GCM10010260_56600 [Streptomyces filipinensis]
MRCGGAAFSGTGMTWAGIPGCGCSAHGETAALGACRTARAAGPPAVRRGGRRERALSVRMSGHGSGISVAFPSGYPAGGIGGPDFGTPGATGKRAEPPGKAPYE